MLLPIGVTLCCLIGSIQPQINNQNSDNLWKPGEFYTAQNGQIYERVPAKPFNGLSIGSGTQRPSVAMQSNIDSSSLYFEDVPQTFGTNQQKRKQPQVDQQYLSNSRPSREPQEPTLPQVEPQKKGLFSITNFGLNIFKNIVNSRQGNVVVSPFSIASVLAVLQQGARGQTQNQISTALELSPTDSVKAFTSFKEASKKHESRNIFKTANNVFIADSFTLNPNFKQTVLRDFGSEISRLNFDYSDAAARNINNWVSDRTNHKIENLVSPDSLGPTTIMVLVNALYFKGIWDVPFRPQSNVEKPFHLSNGQTKEVTFMRVTRYFRSGIDSATDAQVLSLPFEFADYSMMFILPPQSLSVSDVLSTLNSDRLISYTAFDRVETSVEIPKFSIRADTDLAGALRQVGITEIFSQNAELNAIGSKGAASPQISSAVHSAVLSIDEQGGSASSSTAFAAVALSNDEPSLKFIANRPFIAVLWDEKSSLPLFMAKIEDPSIIVN